MANNYQQARQFILDQRRQSAADRLIQTTVQNKQVVYYVSVPGCAYRQGTRAELRRFLFQKGYV